ncbi:Ribonuclease R [Posidoniimonas polymericola]|uniref:Ribonuclease R n=1 Tax=Posidoniimonas polymericola TaxID=2528002 RepID=A0A5C5YRK2_9BACT|nr:ribonuclease R [Posidoniimonas polymericola]TWT77478.1 Ribonuclease R [Posidoniimonas polymericola]
MHDELRAAILSYTSSPAYKPMKPRLIGERLGLEGDDLDLVKKVVKKLVKEGELEYGPRHMVLPSKADHPARAALSDGSLNKEAKPASRGKSSKHVVGTFRRVTSGDGFVRPEGTPASAGKDADIYVNKRDTGDAANGDTVRIELTGKAGHRGKAEGKLVDVVSRVTNKFVGTYLEQDGNGLVQIDGKVFAAPIYVGDPGAKGAQPDDKVVLEMVRFPSQLREGEGVITQVLGARGAPGVDTLSVIHEFGLPGDFSEEVQAESRRQAELFDESIGPDRRDLTGEVIVTIDPLTARDFDDAISLRKAPNGHWELGVHIADVSHFVQEKTPLDREAYDRATSVYLPDQVIPMLPEIISNNLASLQPDKVRYAMTAVIEFTEEGVPIGAEVFKSAIKSRRRFTYEEVDEYLAEKGLVEPRQDAKPSNTGVVSTLAREVDTLVAQMFELAMILRKRRFERGALELNMPELEIDLDKQGRVSGAHLEVSTESHQIIEEFMLAANEAVARHLADAGLIFLRRAHGAPDPRKSKALTEFVRSLGFTVDNLQDRFELQKLLMSIKGDPREHAVNFATLRSMQRAIYSPEDEGHYALASDCYCHFTSPIRRYPDLTVHRLINELNAGKKPKQEIGTYFQWGDHCSDREGRATAAERELNKVKLLDYLKDKVGLEMRGVVTGVESFGLFVAGKELPAEGLVHISSLSDDYYKYDRASHSINGFRGGNSYRLGDEVQIAVAAVNVDARELDFRILGKGPQANKPKKRGRGGPQNKGGSPSKKGKGSPSGRPPRGKSDKTGKQRRKKP